METLKYTAVRKVKDLNRAHPTDAGIDFYIPEDLSVADFAPKCQTTGDDLMITLNEQKFIKDIVLKPGQSVLIPSGIHVKIPHGYALIYFNKSGVASKKHLHVGANVVDECYQGECHLNLSNVGTTDITISAGDKIVQGILIPINYAQAEKIESLEELYADGKSDRGTGGFGSSGTK